MVIVFLLLHIDTGSEMFGELCVSVTVQLAIHSGNWERDEVRFMFGYSINGYTN